MPFELGRPLGAPGNADFQTTVLVSALELLAAESGPVLVDFPKEAPDAGDADGQHQDAWSCPVGFSAPAQKETDLEKQVSALKQELTELLPWYDKRLQARGRTAVATFDPEAAADLLSDYLLDRGPKVTDPAMTLAVAIRLAVQDLKTFYYEAVSYQPGTSPPTSRAFATWFWAETACAGLIRSVRDKCATESDQAMKMTGKMFLVPMGC